MIPPRNAKKFSISAFAEGVALLLSVIILTGLTYLGVQWFADSVDGWLYQGSSPQQNGFPAALEASASVRQIVQPAPQPVAEAAATAAPVVPPKAWFSLEFNQAGQTVLEENNSQQVLPVASLTKLMTALVVLQNYDLSQNVTVSETAMAQEGVQGVLKLGDVLSVKDLLYISLIESSNRAAYALSEVMGAEAFVSQMNRQAESLGLAHTHFADPTGLSDQSVSSAGDIAVLTKYLVVHYPLFLQITGTASHDAYSANGRFHHTLATTNALLGKSKIVGGKTGYTQAALGCYMVIQKTAIENQFIVNVVLGAEDRVAAMQDVINLTSE